MKLFLTGLNSFLSQSLIRRLGDTEHSVSGSIRPFSTFKNNIIENLGVEKQFISSILELIGEVKVEKPRHIEEGNINQMDISPKNRENCCTNN